MSRFRRTSSVLAALLTVSSPPRPAIAQSAPVLTAAEFAARRDSFATLIGNGVVVAFGARRQVHDYGMFFQLPSFRYLTNYEEPDAALVMVVRDKRASGMLFITTIDARRAFYEGPRLDTATAQRQYGLRGRSYEQLASTLDSLAKMGLPFYHVPDVETMDFAANDSLTRGQEAVKSLSRRHPKLEIRNAMPYVLQLRARKSPAELALIRQAAVLSSEGHRAAMLTANPQREYELRAALEYTFTRMGAERVAYGSIVGSGINGTQLHYMKDSDPVKPGEMVVMDAAGELHGYAADITRTIPVSGVFSPEQKQLYQLVRDAQDIAERNSKAGMRPSVATDSSVIVRAKGLAELGLIESVDASFDPPWQVNCATQVNACRQSNLWMIHGISHGIGLEVHDPTQAQFGQRTYQVGDAFTIEPGIYISTRALDVLPDTPRNRQFKAKVRAAVLKYQNIGVRIEDDYIITEQGLERISLAPREIAEIEALMRQRRVVQP